MANISNSITNLIVTAYKSENAEPTIAQVEHYNSLLEGLARGEVARDLGAKNWRALGEEIRNDATTLDLVAQKMKEIESAGMKAAGPNAVPLEDMRRLAEVTEATKNATAEIGITAKEAWATFEQGGLMATEADQKVIESESLLLRSLQQTENVIIARGKAWSASSSALADVLRKEEMLAQETDALKTSFADMMMTMSKGEWEKAFPLAKQAQDAGQVVPAMTRVVEVTKQGATATESYDEAIQALHRDTNNIIRQADELAGEQVRLIEGWAASGKSMEQMKALAQGNYITLSQLKQTLADLGFEIEKTTKSGDKYSQGIGQQIRDARAFRYGGLEIMGVLSMMSIAMGEQLPNSMREFEKSTMLITSGGLATAMMKLGTTPGLVIGGILALGASFLSVEQSVADLNKSLDSMAKQDDVVNAMSKILNVSKETAKSFNEMAKSSPEVAAALRDVVDSTREMSGGEKILREIGEGWGYIAQAIGMANTNLNQFLRENIPGVQSMADAVGGLTSQFEEQRRQRAIASAENLVTAGRNAQAEEYNKEITKENTDALKAQEEQTKALRKANDDLFDAYVNAGNQFNEANARAMQSLNQAMAQAAQQRADQLQRLSFQQQQQAERDAEAWRKIQDTLRDAEEKAWQTYNDRIFDAGIKLRDKLADLDFEYNRKLQDFEDERLKRAYELSDKLYQIERDRIQALAALDFDTALALSKAKTENDKDEVMYRAMHEREQINQRAQNQIEDTLRKNAQDEADAAKRKRDYEAEYAYRRMVAEREYQEELAVARRTYEEARKAAIDNYNDQVAAQQFAQKQQHEQLQQQALEIERTYKEQTAAALQRYKDETAAALKRYEDEKLAADKRWQDEKKQIQDTYNDKVKAIQDEWALFVQVHEQKMRALEMERDIAIQGSTYYYATHPEDYTGNRALPGGANGLDMIVPPGFANDSYLVRASSGEHVSIEPSATSGGSTTVSIAVEPMFAPMIQALMQKLIASGALRQGVEVVLNDAVAQG